MTMDLCLRNQYFGDIPCGNSPSSHIMFYYAIGQMKCDLLIVIQSTHVNSRHVPYSPMTVYRKL